MKTEVLSRVAVAVVATSDTGQVHLFRYSFECSASDRSNGTHHELANKQCSSLGFKPKVAIDESEPAWEHLASRAEMQIDRLDVAAADMPVRAYMHVSNSDCISAQPHTYVDSLKLVSLDDAKRACNYYQSRFSQISSSCKNLEERNESLEQVLEKINEILVDPQADLNHISEILQHVTVHRDLFIARPRG